MKPKAVKIVVECPKCRDRIEVAFSKKQVKALFRAFKKDVREGEQLRL